MFTGVIRSTGMLASLGDGRLVIETQPPLDLVEGDSVAVNGVCLTATEVSDRGGFDADVMPETLRQTTLGGLREGVWVNIELPLRASDRLDGHIVQGHVDGVAEVHSATEEGNARVVRLSPPPELLRYVVPKGSIAVDGVSLTLVDVDPGGFSVMLIPHTLAVTTLGGLAPGDRVNIEADMIAKHVAKLLKS